MCYNSDSAWPDAHMKAKLNEREENILIGICCVCFRNDFGLVDWISEEVILLAEILWS